MWLLVACAVAWAVPRRALAQHALVAGLALSSAYLGWSVLAKALVDRAAVAALAPMGLAHAPRFSVPQPFNTLLWRVVAMTPDGYVMADRSLVADRGPMRFAAHASDTAALQAVAAYPAVQRGVGSTTASCARRCSRALQRQGACKVAPKAMTRWC